MFRWEMMAIPTILNGRQMLVSPFPRGAWSDTDCLRHLGTEASQDGARHPCSGRMLLHATWAALVPEVLPGAGPWLYFPPHVLTGRHVSLFGGGGMGDAQYPGRRLCDSVTHRGEWRDGVPRRTTHEAAKNLRAPISSLAQSAPATTCQPVPKAAPDWRRRCQ